MRKTYQKEDLVIVWQPDKCIHCGDCARGLSAVFKPGERPWIQTDHASKKEIEKQVLACPSGALSLG